MKFGFPKSQKIKVFWLNGFQNSKHNLVLKVMQKQRLMNAMQFWRFNFGFSIQTFQLSPKNLRNSNSKSSKFLLVKLKLLFLISKILKQWNWWFRNWRIPPTISKFHSQSKKPEISVPKKVKPIPKFRKISAFENSTIFLM